MCFDISVDDNDYIEFNIFNLFHSKEGKRSITSGRLITAVIAVFAFVIITIFDNDKSGHLLFAIFLLIISVVSFFRYPKQAKKRVKKSLVKLREEGRFPYEPEAHVEFDETEIVETYPTGVNRIQYSDIKKLYVTKEYIYLFFGAVQAIILPVRCLGEREEELQELLVSKGIEKEIVTRGY